MTFLAARPRPILARQRFLLSSGACAALILMAAMMPIKTYAAESSSFDLPQGFVAVPDDERAAGGEWTGVETVTPSPGPFSDLSAIRLRRVNGAVDDVDAWLKARMTATVDTEAAGVDRLLDGPDSPFSGPAFDGLRATLPKMLRELDALGSLPLNACDGPKDGRNAAGPLRQLDCTFAVGPFRHFRVLRLQRSGDRWFYTEIRAMNELRLRELIAIADTFGPTL
jgi:hypothetical protein